MNESEIEKMLVDNGALLEGHFLLTSGRHSGRYIEKFRILEKPALTSRLCGELANRFRGKSIACVVGPVTGGIILAFEVARQLGCRAVYAERDESGTGFALRRGFALAQGERVLVVEDIVTTGGSVKQVIDVVRRHQGDVVGVGLLVDRSGGSVDYGAPNVEALLRLDIETYAPDDVPAELLAKHGPAIKPGSSKQPVK